MKYFFTTKLFSLRSPSLSAGILYSTPKLPQSYLSVSLKYSMCIYLFNILIVFFFFCGGGIHKIRVGLQHPKDLAKAELIKIWAVRWSPFRYFYYASHMQTYTFLKHSLLTLLQFKGLFNSTGMVWQVTFSFRAWFADHPTPTSNK